jgi:pimeloyl-ACP methyl ester carboxylesterase
LDPGIWTAEVRNNLNHLFGRLGSCTDAVLTRYAANRPSSPVQPGLAVRIVATPLGPVRVYDSDANLSTHLSLNRPCVLITPDGPNVIEHHAGQISLLSPHVRVVCFDMPGFGHSLPQNTYVHSLNQGAAVIVSLMDALGIDRATLAFSCANGFYALRIAQIAPHRISQLVLSQTPSLRAIRAWARRAIPWPVLAPVVGQIGTWLFRRKLARDWYHVALPSTTDRTPYQETAIAALDGGGCFCLAGVAQGLAREPVDSLKGINTPCTLIWGMKDRSHKGTAPASLLEYAPNAELIRFDDTGHFPDLEQSKRYAEILLDKVGRLTMSAAEPEFSRVTSHGD